MSQKESSNDILPVQETENEIVSVDKVENDIIEISEQPKSAEITIESPQLTINEKYMYNGFIDTTDKMAEFNTWCEQEGVIMPKLEYPAYFEGGLLGMRCKEDIKHREAYICVPYKMLMSVKDTWAHPTLMQIIAENPEMFSEDANESWEQLTLVLRLFYEITLGEKGYWYHYLRQMPDIVFTSAWEKQEINQIQDITIGNKLKRYHNMLQQEWKSFQRILRKYPKVFPKRYVTKELFMNQYGQVCTRCFGYGLDSTSMVPMADNMNHSSVEVTQEVVNLQIHPKGNANESYYRVNKYLNDYSHLYKVHGFSDEFINQHKLNIKGRYNWKMYELNTQSLSIDNLRANLLLNKKQIWQVPYNIDNFAEDNDSSDESDSDEEEIMQKKLQKNGKILEEFLKKEKKILQERLKKKQAEEQQTGVTDITEEEDKLKEVLFETNVSNARINEIMMQNSNYGMTQDLQITDNMLNALEYICLEEDGPTKERERDWLLGGSDEESDEDFSWVEDLETIDFKCVKNQTYFCFINEMRRPMKKGTQAWNCYGNRNNEYLLINYGFCFPNNLYDSFTFHVKMDLEVSKEKPIVINQMFAYNKYAKGKIQEIKLKSNQFNEALISYLRIMIKEEYFNINRGTTGKGILISQPIDLHYEVHCLEKYLEMMEVVFTQLQTMSTLDQDMAMLGDPSVSGNTRMAIVYRSERKKILDNQIKLITWLIKVVKESEVLQEMKKKGEDMQNIHQLYQSLYLQPMEFEKDQIDSKGQFKDVESDDEQWYQYRRLYLRAYLQQVFEIRIK